MHNLKLPSHIPLASSYDPIAFAKVRIDSHNREKVPSADYDCPKCLNKERIAFLRENGTPGFRDCDCKAVRRSIRAMKKSGLEAVIRDLTFDRFQATEPWQKRIFPAAKPMPQSRSCGCCCAVNPGRARPTYAPRSAGSCCATAMLCNI